MSNRFHLLKFITFRVLVLIYFSVVLEISEGISLQNIRKSFSRKLSIKWRLISSSYSVFSSSVCILVN